MWGEDITVISNGSELVAKGIVSFKSKANDKEYLIYSLGNTTEQEGKTYQKVFCSQINDSNLKAIDDTMWNLIKQTMSKIGGVGSTSPDYEYTQSITKDAKINVFEPKKIGLEEYVVKAMDNERVKYMKGLEEQEQQQAEKPAKFISDAMIGDTQEQPAEQPTETATVDSGVNAFNMSLPSAEVTTVDTSSTSVPEAAVQEPVAPVTESPEVAQVPQEQPVVQTPVESQPAAPVVEAAPVVQPVAEAPAPVAQPQMLDTSVPTTPVQQPVVEAAPTLPENVKNAIINLYNLLENDKDKVLEAINKYEEEKNVVQQAVPVAATPVEPQPAAPVIETAPVAQPVAETPAPTADINLENIPVVEQATTTDSIPTQDREFTGNTGPIPVVNPATDAPVQPVQTITTASGAPVSTDVNEQITASAQAAVPVQSVTPVAAPQMLDTTVPVQQPVVEAAPVVQPVAEASAPVEPVAETPVEAQPAAPVVDTTVQAAPTLAPVVALDQQPIQPVVEATPTEPQPVAQTPVEAQPAAPVVEAAPVVQPVAETPAPVQQPIVEAAPVQPVVEATNVPEAPTMAAPETSTASILGEGAIPSEPPTMPGGQEPVDDPNLGLIENESQEKKLVLAA